MAIDRLVSLILRGAELVFAAIVAGVNGQYLHHNKGTGGSQWRFIYTEVIAALGIFFALIWLIPFSGTFIHWPIDLVLSILFWIAFGVLVNVSHDPCSSFPTHAHGSSTDRKTNSLSEAAVAPSSTGTMSTPSTATSAASSRPPLPLLSSAPSCSSPLL